MSKLVSVTGPIAAGATTLSKRLVLYMGWQEVFEVDVERQNPFFKAYNQDQKEWGFHNQVTFLTQSAEAHAKLKPGSDGPVFVQDFTPFEHTEVYAYVQRELGLLSSDEYDVLVRLARVLEATYCPPAALVYRPLSKDMLMQRVQSRARPSELGMSQSFMEAVQVRFEEWISTWTRSPVVRVDPALDAEADKDGVISLGKQVLDVIGEA